MEVGGFIGRRGEGVFIGFGVINLGRMVSALGHLGNHTEGQAGNNHKCNGASKRKNAEQVVREGSKSQHGRIFQQDETIRMCRGFTKECAKRESVRNGVFSCRKCQIFLTVGA